MNYISSSSSFYDPVAIAKASPYYKAKPGSKYEAKGPEYCLGYIAFGEESTEVVLSWVVLPNGQLFGVSIDYYEAGKFHSKDWRMIEYLAALGLDK